FHKQREAAVTLTLVHVPNPLEYGVVITNEDGRIAKFLEKPSWGEVFSDTINTGIYVMEPRVLKRYAVGEVFDFSKDLFPKLLAEGEPLFGYVADGYWTDIGSIAEYARANADLLQGKVRTAPLGRERARAGTRAGEDLARQAGRVRRRRRLERHLGRAGPPRALRPLRCHGPREHRPHAGVRRTPRRGLRVDAAARSDDHDEPG